MKNKTTKQIAKTLAPKGEGAPKAPRVHIHTDTINEFGFCEDTLATILNGVDFDLHSGARPPLFAPAGSVSANTR